MNLILQVILFIVSVLIGGLLVELMRKGKASNIKLLLSFSGGFLLTIIFVHILPESYESLANTGYFILIGFFLQLVLEYFSQGAEHGHTHLAKHGSKVSFPFAIFISLSIHSFFEAIPLNHGGHTHAEQLYWGVFMHKVPVAVALKTILETSGISKRGTWIYLILFALTAPLGLLFGEWVLGAFNVSLEWMLAIAIGMFLHVSTTIIFESSEGHKINTYKLLAILAGFGVGFLISG